MSELSEGETDTGDELPEPIESDKNLEWPSDMKMLSEDKFDVNVKTLFEKLFADSAQTFEMVFRRERGDSDVTVSPWTSDQSLALVRDVGFRHVHVASYFFSFLFFLFNLRRERKLDNY